AALAAEASPVSPVLPESPDRSAANGVPLPLMPVFSAVSEACTSPVLPESPELPEVAVGLAVAVELAAPVSPVLGADDWAREDPESAVMVVGVRSGVPLAWAPPLVES